MKYCFTLKTIVRQPFPGAVAFFLSVMNIRSFVCLFGILLPLFLFSQAVQSPFRTEHPHGAKLDSMVRTEVGGALDDSYFIITYPVVGATTSWVPQFVETYQSVKKLGRQVVLVLNNQGGLRARDLPLFLQETLQLNQEEIKKITVVSDTQLYHTLNQKTNLVRLFYFYRRHLYYNGSTKWNKTNPIYFPRERVEINFDRKTELLDIDTLLVQAKDPVFKYQPNQWLLLTNTRNEIVRIHSISGKAELLLNVSKRYSAADLYCTFFARNDSSKCRYAQEYEPKVRATGRKIVRVSSVHPLGKDTLMFTLQLEVMEVNEEVFAFKNDQGDSTLINKGQSVLTPYSLLGFYDLKTGAISFRKVEEVSPQGQREHYTMLENGLRVEQNRIYTSSLVYTPDSTLLHLTQIDLTDSSAQVVGYREPASIQSAKFDLFYNQTFFVNYSSQSLVILNCEPDLYLEGQNEIQSRFFGDGHKPYAQESIPSYLEDTLTAKINFLIHDVSPIIDGKFLAAYIKYQGRPLLEIKNRMLKTVDVIDLSYLPPFANYNADPFRNDMQIANDRLVFKMIEGDEMYWYEYKLSLKAY
ncbi:hypothetical protein KFE98_16930 [bacterium SCSIO 12741]|nr:hypothetical protein KFE98_16930 [bacterium SCSIO 12741]